VGRSCSSQKIASFVWKYSTAAVEHGAVGLKQALLSGWDASRRPWRVVLHALEIPACTRGHAMYAARLGESPAEPFASLFVARWLKPVCVHPCEAGSGGRSGAGLLLRYVPSRGSETLLVVTPSTSAVMWCKRIGWDIVMCVLFCSVAWWLFLFWDGQIFSRAEYFYRQYYVQLSVLRSAQSNIMLQGGMWLRGIRKQFPSLCRALRSWLGPW